MRETGRIGTSCSDFALMDLAVSDTIDVRMRGDTAFVDLGGGVISTYPSSLYMEFIR